MAGITERNCATLGVTSKQNLHSSARLMAQLGGGNRDQLAKASFTRCGALGSARKVGRCVRLAISEEGVCQGELCADVGGVSTVSVCLGEGVCYCRLGGDVKEERVGKWRCKCIIVSLKGVCVSMKWKEHMGGRINSMSVSVCPISAEVKTY